MQERDINIIEYLFEYIKPFNDLSEESIITTISKAFDTLYKSDNPRADKTVTFRFTESGDSENN